MSLENLGLPPFDVKAENVSSMWRKYLRSFRYMVDGRAITDSAQKKALLLHLAGTEVQDIYETLEPKEPAVGDKFDECVDSLTTYFAPKSNRTYERHLFRRLRQDDDTVDHFITRVKQQANLCDFDNPDDSLSLIKLLKDYDRKPFVRESLKKVTSRV